MAHRHAFGNLLKQLRSRVPGLTQARVAVAGALRDVAEANALLAAANLSPLIEASAEEASVLQRLYRHSDSRSTTRYGAVSGTAPAYVRQLLQEYVRIWDKATHEGERMVVLAAAGELAMRYRQPALGMRLLARAALAEASVQETELMLPQAFAQQIGAARAKLGEGLYANAWVAGQMLTLHEARAWLVALPSLLGNGKENYDR